MGRIMQNRKRNKKDPCPDYLASKTSEMGIKLCDLALQCVENWNLPSCFEFLLNDTQNYKTLNHLTGVQAELLCLSKVTFSFSSWLLGSLNARRCHNHLFWWKHSGKFSQGVRPPPTARYHQNSKWLNTNISFILRKSLQEKLEMQKGL